MIIISEKIITNGHFSVTVHIGVDSRCHFKNFIHGPLSVQNKRIRIFKIKIVNQLLVEINNAEVFVQGKRCITDKTDQPSASIAVYCSYSLSSAAFARFSNFFHLDTKSSFLPIVTSRSRTNEPPKS